MIDAEHTVPQAKMLLTAMAIGRPDLHDKFIQWMFHPYNYASVYHNFPWKKEAYLERDRGFLHEVGDVDTAKFWQVYNSKDMEDRLAAARAEEKLYGVDKVGGPPVFVINGKYATTVYDMPRARCADLNAADSITRHNCYFNGRMKDPARMMRVIDYLIHLESKR
jgi:hypothetical protein